MLLPFYHASSHQEISLSSVAIFCQESQPRQKVPGDEPLSEKEFEALHLWILPLEERLELFLLDCSWSGLPIREYHAEATDGPEDS